MEEESLEAVNAVCPHKLSLFRKWRWTATQNTHFHEYQTPETLFTNGSCVCSYYWYGFSYNMIRKKIPRGFHRFNWKPQNRTFSYEQRKVLESKRSFAMKLGRCAYHYIKLKILWLLAIQTIEYLRKRGCVGQNIWIWVDTGRPQSRFHVSWEPNLDQGPNQTWCAWIRSSLARSSWHISTLLNYPPPTHTHTHTHTHTQHTATCFIFLFPKA